MKAWVVTVQSLKTDHMKGNPIRVICALSVRRDVGNIKNYIEDLYNLFFLKTENYLEITTYKNPKSFIEVRSDSGHDIYAQFDSYILRAQKSESLRAWKEDELSWLEWKTIGFQRFKYDVNTYKIDGHEWEPQKIVKARQLEHKWDELFN